ncbi:type II CAAX endopeptidase family protein [Lactobacillus corticis]|uniref:CAAX prenyl protease 2/Lysostaphin resistance protein A-like domain-containing protein n=1 Tax=Lactobacillus corticis TaxID=2201249 RepID=A0A916VHS2_9LACO|nr:type II CAAX endopeptidase family protein [Lactobacillus corticis]GFZ26490.1 hypothetical protein LCB40_03700 [Lactobacillus corticis]
MKKIGQTLGRFVAMIVTYYLYAYLQYFYFYPQKAHLHRSSGWLLALGTVAVLAFIFWMYKKTIPEADEWHFNEEPHWDWHRLGIAVLGYILIVFASVVSLNLVGGGTSANQSALNAIEKNGSRGLYNLMVVFIAPFCEETLFRGMLLNVFFRHPTRTNKVLAVLVSGFCFAYMHDPTFSKYIIVYLLLGCILAWVYVETRDLRYSMLVHMCYNALGVL